MAALNLVRTFTTAVSILNSWLDDNFSNIQTWLNGNVGGAGTDIWNHALAAKNSEGTGTVPYADETGLRVIRGTVTISGVTPSVAYGTGFSVSRNGQGDYIVTFTVPFSAIPTIAPSAKAFGGTSSFFADYDSVLVGSCHIYLFSDGNLTRGDGPGFSFIAIGPK